MTQEALKLALEALEKALHYHGVMLLSDPPQDAWKYHRVEQTAHEAITAIKEALAEHAMQEVQRLGQEIEATERKWVDLTDDEIDRVTDAQWGKNVNKPIYAAHRAYARAVEAASKEKNT